MEHERRIHAGFGGYAADRPALVARLGEVSAGCRQYLLPCAARPWAPVGARHPALYAGADAAAVDCAPRRAATSSPRPMSTNPPPSQAPSTISGLSSPAPPKYNAP